MKKMKFTLGLAFSLLILGAGAAHAQQLAQGGVRVSYVVKACNFYADDITIYQTVNNVTLQTINFDKDFIQAKDSVIDASDFWVYDSLPGISNNLYEIHANNWDALTSFSINLAYVKGNDLEPIVKRTVTVGTLGDNWGIAQPLIQHVHYLKEIIPNGFFRPIMDRETGIAEYYYEEPIIPLFGQTVIYSIVYEISIHDKTHTPGYTPYDMPTSADVYTQYGLQFVAGEELVIDPVTNGEVFYWPSQKDFVFTVKSAKPITVSTDADATRLAGGIIINDNVDGTFTVTIRKVNKVMKISVNAVSTESDETGNEVIAGDAVWAAGGLLNVQAGTAATLSIYTVTGQLYKQLPVSGSFTIPLAKGLYIVQLNGKAYKIIN